MAFLLICIALTSVLLTAMESKMPSAPCISTDLSVFENYGFRSPELELIKYDQLKNLKKKNAREYSSALKKVISGNTQFPLFHYLRAEELARRTSDQALAEAAVHCEKAQDYPPAQLQLARMYLEGKGVEKDKQHALKILEKAAAVRTMHLAGYKFMPRSFYFCYLPALKQLAEIYRDDNDSENFLRCLEWGMLIESNPEREQWSYQAGVLNFWQGNLTRAYKAFSLGKSSNDNQAGLLFLQAQQAWMSNNIDSTVNLLSSILKLKNNKEGDFFAMARDWLHAIIQRSTNVELFDRVMPTLIASNNDALCANAVKLCDELLTTLKKCCDLKARDAQIKKYYNSVTFKMLQKMEKSDSQAVREIVLHHLGQVCHAVTTADISDESARKQAIGYFEQLNPDNLDAQLYLGSLYGLSKEISDLDKASSYYGTILDKSAAHDLRRHFALDELHRLDRKNNWRARGYLLACYANQKPVYPAAVTELLDNMPPEAFDDFCETGAFAALTHCVDEKNITDAFIHYLKKADAAHFIKEECKKKVILYLEPLTKQSPEYKLFLCNLSLGCEDEFQKAISLLPDVWLQIEKYDSKENESLTNDIIHCSYLLEKNCGRDGKIALALANFYKKGVGRSKKDNKGKEVGQIIGEDTDRAFELLEQASSSGVAHASYQCAIRDFKQGNNVAAINYFERTMLQVKAQDDDVIFTAANNHLSALAKLEQYDGSYEVIKVLANNEGTIEQAIYYARRLIDKCIPAADWGTLQKIEPILKSLTKKSPKAEFNLGLLYYLRGHENSDYVRSIEDFQLALNYMESAFNHGYKNEIEQLFLYNCYLKLGLHALLTYDYSTAITWLKKSIDTRSFESLYYLSRTFFELGVKKDKESFVSDTVQHFQLLANRGCPQAILFIARKSFEDATFFTKSNFTQDKLAGFLQLVAENEENLLHFRLSAFELLKRLNKQRVLATPSFILPSEQILPENADYIEGRICYANGDYANAMRLLEKIAQTNIYALGYLILCQLKTEDAHVANKFGNTCAEFAELFAIKDCIKPEFDELMQAMNHEFKVANTHIFEVNVLKALIDLKKYMVFKNEQFLMAMSHNICAAADYFFKTADQQEVKVLSELGATKQLFKDVLQLSTKQPTCAYFVASIYFRSALYDRCLFEHNSVENNLKLAIQYANKALKQFTDESEIKNSRDLLNEARLALAKLYDKKLNDKDAVQTLPKNTIKTIVNLLQQILKDDPTNKDASVIIFKYYLNGETHLKGNEATAAGVEQLKRSAEIHADNACLVWPLLVDGALHTYQCGGRIDPRPELAGPFLKKAAESGHLPSMRAYSKALFYGRYKVKKDQNQALELLTKIHEKSSCSGDLTQKGIFHLEMQDYESAVSCFKESITNGQVRYEGLTCVYLAHCCRLGLGTPVSKVEVLNHLDAALDSLKTYMDNEAWKAIHQLNLYKYLFILPQDADPVIVHRAKFVAGKLFYVQHSNACFKQSACKSDIRKEIENSKKEAIRYLSPFANDPTDSFYIQSHCFLADVLTDWLCLNIHKLDQKQLCESIAQIIEHLKKIASDNYVYSNELIKTISMTMVKFFNLWDAINKMDALTQDQNENSYALIKSMTETIKKTNLKLRINETLPEFFLKIDDNEENTAIT